MIKLFAIMAVSIVITAISIAVSEWIDENLYSSILMDFVRDFLCVFVATPSFLIWAVAAIKFAVSVVEAIL